MSFLNIGRKAPLVAPAEPVDPAVRQPWWRWNPYRRDDAVRIERAQVEQDRVGQTRIDREGRSEGYVEGRRDERAAVVRQARRRGHPVLATIVFLLAAITVGYGYLSYEAGSFAGGGAMIDDKIAEMRGDVGRAGEVSGQAVQNAGARITDHSRQLSKGPGN